MRDPATLCTCGHPRNHHQRNAGGEWLCVTCYEDGKSCTKDATK